MKILLRGYYGFGNFGDDLLLFACYAVVRRKFPSAQISIFANFSEALQEFNGPAGYREYVHSILGETPELIDWRDQRNFDLEIYGGGGVFKSGQRRKFASLSNIFALALGASRVSGMISGVRKFSGRKPRIRSLSAIAVGVGVESYDNFGENLIRDMEQIGRLGEIYVRDNESALNLRRLGRECQIGSDLAFLLKERFGKKRVERSKRKGIGAVLCAGKPKTSQILEFLRNRNNVEPVTLIFFDENYDRDLIKEAHSKSLNVLVWRPREITIDQFIEQLAQFSLVISNRFHGALAAAMLDIPSIVLETDAKLKSASHILPNSVENFPLSGSIDDLHSRIDTIKSNDCFLSSQIELDINHQYMAAQRMIASALKLQND